eukprot:2643188-Prymnesium_polylepis.1
MARAWPVSKPLRKKGRPPLTNSGCRGAAGATPPGGVRTAGVRRRHARHVPLVLSTTPTSC